MYGMSEIIIALYQALKVPPWINARAAVVAHKGYRSDNLVFAHYESGQEQFRPSYIVL